MIHRPSAGRPAFRTLALTAAGLALVLGVSNLESGAFAATSKEEAAAPLDATFRKPEGGTERLSDHRGSRLLLDLWATWCLPCRQQSQILHTLAEDLEQQKVKVLAVNVGQGPRLVLDFLSRTPSPHPVLLDRGQQVSSLLGIRELPALVLLREDGTVAGVRTGLVERKDLETWIRETFAEPAKAR